MLSVNKLGPLVVYVVLTNTFCDGWVNTWSADGQPHVFNSWAEAQAELDNFLLDSKEDGLDYSRDQYKIVGFKGQELNP